MKGESIYLAPLILPESYKICEFTGANLYVRFREKKILPVADPGERPGGPAPPLILCPFQTFSMPVFNILLKISRHVVQNVSRHLSYLARPVIRDHVQLGISSKGQTVTHCCEKQRMYESKFQGKNYPLWLPRNKSDPVKLYIFCNFTGTEYLSIV